MFSFLEADDLGRFVFKPRFKVPVLFKDWVRFKLKFDFTYFYEICDKNGFILCF